MKPAPFTYHDPTTIQGAVEMLGTLENARPLAGGQSLVAMMNFRYAVPDHLVDLNRIAALSGIAHGEDFRIGAMTRQRDIEFSGLVARHCPILQEAILNVGHRQTRNRGTIGGSLCHADAAAELPAVMLLCDAVMTAASSAGQRDIAAGDFLLGFMTTALEPNELLTGLKLSPWSPRHGYAFEEFARRHGDFAIAGVGILIELNTSFEVDRLAIVVAGVGPRPVRLADVEERARGHAADDALIAEAGVAAGSVEAVGDAHVSAGYRRHLATVLTQRAMRRAISRARQRMTVDA